MFVSKPFRILVKQEGEGAFLMRWDAARMSFGILIEGV